MKTFRSYTTAVVTASLMATGTALAQDSDRPAREKMGSAGTTLSAISRVPDDHVKERFTAKDLIGESVYDRAGEKIGDIADLDLTGIAPRTLSAAFATTHAGDLPRSGSAMAGTSGSPRPSMMSSADGGLSSATIFVSVGGLWGMGDDMVSVPLSHLSYNSTEKRFEISSTKADVVALAEGKRTTGYAARSPLSQTSVGKQSFDDEANRVLKALQSDPQTSAFAKELRVMAREDKLEIHGVVTNKEQKKLVMEAAKRATSFDLEDKITVR